jgi:hypothetical protein
MNLQRLRNPPIRGEAQRRIRIQKVNTIQSQRLEAKTNKKGYLVSYTIHGIIKY